MKGNQSSLKVSWSLSVEDPLPSQPLSIVSTTSVAACSYPYYTALSLYTRLVTDQIRFKSEAGHSIFVCNYVFYEHPQLYFKLTMQFRSAVFGFVNQL